MGNQQSGGMQFCSRGELYANRSDMTSYKLDPEARVGYGIPTSPKFQGQPIQKARLQKVFQQQIQEEVVEIPLSGPGKLKIPKHFFEQQDDSKDIQVEPMCPAHRRDVENQVAEINTVDQSKDDLIVFQGLYGNVTIKTRGTLVYTDINGMKHSEDYDRDNIGKIFPMGISYGGLTKSIWFKDGIARDEAFDFMKSLPPSYNAVMNNPTKYALPEDDDCDDDGSDDMTIFNGINGRKVIVHSENIVLFTDFDNNKHCMNFNPHKISKCFPFGIHDGGLPRAIWFNNEMERDQCFMSMQPDIEEQKFTGLYGSVVLHPDSQIEFTCLSGDRVKCFYEPSEIQESFPKGISYGNLPKSIWFRDIEERTECIEAMRNI